MLNASQLARTRGDGEICTKELPHSLAAFSSRNHAGEEGSFSPIHQSSCSRQRRFTTTPSRSATQRGQDPPIACAPREAELLQNTPESGASKQAVRCGTEQGLERRSWAHTRRRDNFGGSRSRHRRAARREKPEHNLNKMEPPFCCWVFFLIWRCTPPRLHFPACTAGRAPGEELVPGLLSFRRLSLDTGDEPDTGQRSSRESFVGVLEKSLKYLSPGVTKAGQTRSREGGQGEQRPLWWGWLGDHPTWRKAQEIEQSQRSPATKCTLKCQLHTHHQAKKCSSDQNSTPHPPPAVHDLYGNVQQDYGTQRRPAKSQI